MPFISIIAVGTLASFLHSEQQKFSIYYHHFRLCRKWPHFYSASNESSSNLIREHETSRKGHS